MIESKKELSGARALVVVVSLLFVIMLVGGVDAQGVDSFPSQTRLVVITIAMLFVGVTAYGLDRRIKSAIRRSHSRKGDQVASKAI